MIRDQDQRSQPCERLAARQRSSPRHHGEEEAGAGAGEVSGPAPRTGPQTVLCFPAIDLDVLQALLALALGTEQSREKQLLRRELGAELGSITDTWNRHLRR